MRNAANCLHNVRIYRFAIRRPSRSAPPTQLADHRSVNAASPLRDSRWRQPPGVRSPARAQRPRRSRGVMLIPTCRCQVRKSAPSLSPSPSASPALVRSESPSPDRQVGSVDYVVVVEVPCSDATLGSDTRPRLRETPSRRETGTRTSDPACRRQPSVLNSEPMLKRCMPPLSERRSGLA